MNAFSLGPLLRGFGIGMGRLNVVPLDLECHRTALNTVWGYLLLLFDGVGLTWISVALMGLVTARICCLMLLHRWMK